MESECSARCSPDVITIRVPDERTPETDATLAVFHELALAHRVEHGADELTIVDGGERIRASRVPEYLDELRSLVALWRKYQSDACYVEDDGSIC
jgi:hypothetical protein